MPNYTITLPSTYQTISRFNTGPMMMQGSVSLNITREKKLTLDLTVDQSFQLAHLVIVLSSSRHDRTRILFILQSIEIFCYAQLLDLDYFKIFQSNFRKENDSRFKYRDKKLNRNYQHSCSFDIFGRS